MWLLRSTATLGFGFVMVPQKKILTEMYRSCKQYEKASHNF